MRVISKSWSISRPIYPQRRVSVRATTKFKSMLGGSAIVVAPGAFDGLSARLVEQAGFPAVYASGGAIARPTAVPDIGLIPPPGVGRPLSRGGEAGGLAGVAGSPPPPSQPPP